MRDADPDPTRGVDLERPRGRAVHGVDGRPVDASRRVRGDGRGRDARDARRRSRSRVQLAAATRVADARARPRLVRGAGRLDSEIVAPQRATLRRAPGPEQGPRRRRPRRGGRARVATLLGGPAAADERGPPPLRLDLRPPHVRQARPPHRGPPQRRERRAVRRQTRALLVLRHRAYHPRREVHHGRRPRQLPPRPPPDHVPPTGHRRPDQVRQDTHRDPARLSPRRPPRRPLRRRRRRPLRGPLRGPRLRTRPPAPASGLRAPHRRDALAPRGVPHHLRGLEARPPGDHQPGRSPPRRRRRGQAPRPRHRRRPARRRHPLLVPLLSIET
mmetsp:Transcript_5170/g.15703  ORF Transcript_5170/g.15703 Transcript_5170/m.15703 type:complete len:330 (+) Transcript_5170:216-1205(+)